jgi:hypothetical protein
LGARPFYNAQRRPGGLGRRRRDSGLETDPEIGDLFRMSTVKQIESALESLPLEELQAVRDWLDNFIEDQLEVSDEFKAKIQRAKQEIADGVYSRTRKTETGQ